MKSLFKIATTTFFLSYCSCTLQAKILTTREQILKHAFGERANISRKTLFLTMEQVKAIEKAARVKVESKLVTYYVAQSTNGVEGYAFPDSSIVRTMPVTYMVIVNPDATVRFVEIMAFHEPEDYLPHNRWLKLFGGKILEDSLWPRRGIPNVTGATLTVNTITYGVRKILAIYQIAVEKELKQ